MTTARLFRRRLFLADWIFTSRFNLGRTQFAIRMREMQAIEDEIVRRGYPLMQRHSLTRDQVRAIGPTTTEFHNNNTNQEVHS